MARDVAAAAELRLGGGTGVPPGPHVPAHERDVRALWVPHPGQATSGFAPGAAHRITGERGSWGDQPGRPGRELDAAAGA
jgi:hypothetical protein